MILKADFALKLSNYTSFIRFVCLKRILKNVSTILHSQFKGKVTLNYDDSPFKKKL